MRYPRSILSRAVLGAIAASPIAAAQAQEPALEEVLVTGTLIRGIEPTGSQTIGIDEESITELGAVTTNELLATIPQVTNFFNDRAEQDPRGADRLQVNRPNLRSLPGINSATGATTLILVDGHRLAPVGTDQSSLDPDVVPSIVMQRVEVMTDGGSSLYGADAVGGVINFVTMDEYDGVKVDVGYDTGDDYDSWQASLLAGTSWDSGSGYVALATTDRDAVLIGDRDWALQGQWDEMGTELSPTGTECIEPVGAVTTWFNYGAGWTDNPAAPGAGVTPVGDSCDDTARSSLIPEQQRENIYAGLTQDLNDAMSLKVKAYYMDRSTNYPRYPRGDTVSEPSPTELGLSGNVGDLYQSSAVGFSYAPNPAYRERDLSVDIETWGITPELTIDLGNTSWQSRNTLHYGKSDNTVYQPLSNRSKLQAYIAEGAIDPLNIASTDPAVVQDILNWENADEVEQEMVFFRSIADGEVIDLPAGAVRAAVGLEYTEEEVSKRTGEVVRGGAGSLENRKADREVYSVFGELSVPVFDTVDLSLSARYDDYSDFGSTTNPNIGFDWNPTDWLKVFGKWGESFNAPTVLDSVIVANGQYTPNVADIVPDVNGERTNPSRDDAFLLEGGSDQLQPQTAESWGLGFEVRPLEGLSVNLYYYEIEFDELLASPDPQNPEAVRLNPEKFVFEPTEAEFQSFLASVQNRDQFGDISAEDLGVIVDRRISNTDSATLKGYDFGIRYNHDSRFGFMTYGMSGNYISEFELVQTGVANDQLAYNPDLTLSADIGWSGQRTRARLNLRYTSGFDADPDVAINQRSVDDFLTTNLFVGYDFAGTGFTEGLSLRFNVDNVFDEEPPVYRRNQGINYSGWTLGRVYKLGLTYEF